VATSSEHPAADYAGTHGRQGRFADLFTPGVVWRLGLLLVLMICLYRHELRRLVVTWATDQDWSHGFLIPVGSLLFVYLERHRLAAATFRTSLWGLPVLLMGIALYGASIYGKIGYTQALSIVITTSGLVLTLCGWRVTRIVWFALFFLLFALPLPGDVYVAMTMPLRKLSSWISAGILSTVVPSLEAVASGTIIEYVGADGKVGKLDVEQACAGMRLIMAFGAVGVTMAYLFERVWWHRGVLLLSILPIAVVCNIVRVTVTGLLWVTDHPDWATGAPHTLLGLVVLGLALGLFSLISYILNHLFVDVPDDGARGA